MWVGGRLDESWKNGCIDGLMDEWINGWVGGWWKA